MNTGSRRWRRAHGRWDHDQRAESLESGTVSSWQRQSDAPWVVEALSTSGARRAQEILRLESEMARKSEIDESRWVARFVTIFVALPVSAAVALILYGLLPGGLFMDIFVYAVWLLVFIGVLMDIRVLFVRRARRIQQIPCGSAPEAIARVGEILTAQRAVVRNAFVPTDANGQEHA